MPLVELPVYSGNVNTPPSNYLFNTRYIRMVRPMWIHEASSLMFPFPVTGEPAEQTIKFMQGHCILYPDSGDTIIIAYDFETVAKILAGEK